MDYLVSFFYNSRGITLIQLLLYLFPHSVWDLSNLIRGLIYGIVSIVYVLEWIVPPPLATVIEAYTGNKHERFNLDEPYDLFDVSFTTS
jgi:hypothetical protein